MTLAARRAFVRATALAVVGAIASVPFACARDHDARAPPAFAPDRDSGASARRQGRSLEPEAHGSDAITTGARSPASPSFDATVPSTAEGGTDPADEALRRAHQGRAPLRTDRGLATYYSDGLAGRPTASGEPYDPRAFVAAHRTLPFGAVVRVVRPDGRDVFVRVIDRGPFGDAKRIIDVSGAAADLLGMRRAGVVPVVVETLFVPPAG